MSTYIPLASFTTSGGETEVVFSNIPQIYQDLVVVLTTKTNQDSRALIFRINDDTASIYNRATLLGAGASKVNDHQKNQSNYIGLLDAAGTSSTYHHPVYIELADYANKNISHKFALVREAGKGETGLRGVLIENQYQGIHSIYLSHSATTNWSSGNTFDLYAIAGGSLKAMGGDIVTKDSTYFYHAFTSSGTFQVTSKITGADILIVGGGGGGGSYSGGGGGAGQVRALTGQTLQPQKYTITIGAGGPGGGAYGGTGTQGATQGTDGSSTSFASPTVTTTSLGGGGGGATGISSNAGRTGYNGGGGAGASASVVGDGGVGTLFNGGLGFFRGGGGGGMGGIGQDAAGSSSGGNGGAGINTITGYGSFSDTLTAVSLGVSGYLAGGGGGGASSGGTGGTGTNGGGNGSPQYYLEGVDGSRNTGSGGGGGGRRNDISPYAITDGGNGASGLVIVRYAQ